MAKSRKLKLISLVILFFSFLSIFGFSIQYITQGNHLGFLTKPLKLFISFPQISYSVLTTELSKIPPTYIAKDEHFKPVNKLPYDLYGINSSFKIEGNEWGIDLFNFRNDSILHHWYLKKDRHHNAHRNFRNSVPINCILLPERSLIVMCTESQNLYRLDGQSNIIWHNTEYLFHHSINLDHEGNIWAGATIINGEFSVSSYRDDYITHLSTKTGEILFTKSVSEILVENGYKNYIYGFLNHSTKGNDFDPLHLNDIEPVHLDGKFWEKGDLFLSLCNRSLIVLYRPKTNKIIRLIFGPFLHQHDVDIISEEEISLFNNNVTRMDESIMFGTNKSKGEKTNQFAHSEIIIFNFANSTFRKPFEKHFIKENISTRTEGFHQILSTGDTYVESQNDGKVYIMNEEEVLLKKQILTPVEKMVERPHWIRLYENVNF